MKYPPRSIRPLVSYYFARRIWGARAAHQISADAMSIIREGFLALLPPGPGITGMERVRQGRNSIVVRLHLEDDRTLYAHLWPWNPPRGPSREHVLLAKRFGAAGLRVPQVLIHDDSLNAMRRWGVEGLIETGAPGRPLHGVVSAIPSALPRIASDLARLHQCVGKGWGKPWRPLDAMANPRAYYKDRIDSFRRILSIESCGLDEGFIRNGLSSLGSLLAGLPPVSPVLIHGDIHRANLFLGPDGEVTWIDFGTAQYGRPEQDLAAARKLFPAPSEFARFIQAYASHAGRVPDPGVIHVFEMFERWRHLASSAKKIRHHAKAGLARPEDEARLRNAVRWLMKSTEAGPEMNADFTEELKTARGAITLVDADRTGDPPRRP